MLPILSLETKLPAATINKVLINLTTNFEFKKVQNWSKILLKRPKLALKGSFLFKLNILNTRPNYPSSRVVKKVVNYPGTRVLDTWHWKHYSLWCFCRTLFRIATKRDAMFQILIYFINRWKRSFILGEMLNKKLKKEAFLVKL